MIYELFNLQQLCKEVLILALFFPTRNLRHEEVTSLAQGHTVTKRFTSPLKDMDDGHHFPSAEEEHREAMPLEVIVITEMNNITIY